MSAAGYHASRSANICKECGQDVGLYPSRHRCGSAGSTFAASTRGLNSPSLAPPPPREAPSLAPPRLGQIGRTGSGGSASGARYTGRAGGASSGTSLRTGAGRWARVADSTARDAKPTPRPSRHGAGNDDSDHENNNGNNENNNNNNSSSGGGIWSKLRAAAAWSGESEAGNNSDQGEQNEPTSNNSSGNFWGKIKAVANIEKSDEPESDQSDYEGETHVTRLLKEYYRERYPDASLPGWLTQPPPEQPRPFQHLSLEHATPARSASPVTSPRPVSPSHMSYGQGHTSFGNTANTKPFEHDSGYNTMEAPVSPGVGDGYAAGGYTSTGNRSPVNRVAPPARRPARVRNNNVRRDAGAFFDE